MAKAGQVVKQQVPLEQVAGAEVASLPRVSPSESPFSEVRVEARLGDEEKADLLYTIVTEGGMSEEQQEAVEQLKQQVDPIGILQVIAEEARQVHKATSVSTLTKAVWFPERAEHQGLAACEAEQGRAEG
mgnify:FL=1